MSNSKVSLIIPTIRHHLETPVCIWDGRSVTWIGGEWTVGKGRGSSVSNYRQKLERQQGL